MANLLDRITVDPAKRGGRACLRGTRIRIIDVHDLYATPRKMNRGNVLGKRTGA